MKRPLFTNLRSILVLVLGFLAATLPASAMYSISGYVLDQYHQPVVGVNVIASTEVNNNQVSVTNATDATGHYSIPAYPNTAYGLLVDLSSSSAYNQNEPITLTTIQQSRTANFIVSDWNADVNDVELYGYVVDQNNNPVSGIGVSATATTNASGTMNATTDDNGIYQFIVPPGSAWNVSLNCTNLNSFGFECVTDQNVQLGFEDYGGGLNFQTHSQPFFYSEALVSTNAEYYMSTSGSLFGYFNMSFFPFVYHNDMGWEYFIDANNASYGAYFYDFADQAWFYTDPTRFPYLYDFKAGAWMWYEPSSTPGLYTSNPRWFVNLGTGVWGNHL